MQTGRVRRDVELAGVWARAVENPLPLPCLCFVLEERDVARAGAGVRIWHSQPPGQRRAKSVPASRCAHTSAKTPSSLPNTPEAVVTPYHVQQLVDRFGYRRSCECDTDRLHDVTEFEAVRFSNVA